MLSYRVINVKFMYSKALQDQETVREKKNKNVQKIFLGHAFFLFGKKNKKKFQKTVKNILLKKELYEWIMDRLTILFLKKRFDFFAFALLFFFQL